MKRLDAEYAEWSNKQSIAGWNYASNLTEENLEKKLNVSAIAAHVSKKIAQEVNAFPWADLQDENIKRQFKKLSVLGTAALPEDVRIVNQSFSFLEKYPLWKSRTNRKKKVHITIN